MERTLKLTSPFSLLLLLSLIIVIFAYIHWEDVVIRHPDGTYSIDDATADRVADRVDRIQNQAEFYKLVAKSNGYFACPLCPPKASSNGKFFLYYREIYKYGVTINPQQRYSRSELAAWNLDYIVIAAGSYSDMLALETVHSGQYAVLPENLNRPLLRRLAVAPGSGTILR